MKSFQEFREQKEDLYSVVETIRKDCHFFLKSNNKTLIKYPLYRGDKIKTKSTMIKKRVRKDRKPKDTSQIVHDLMDEYTLIVYGKRFRSNSLFTTSEYNEAFYYGGNRPPFMVFPIGSFDFLWSDKVVDFQPYLEPIILNHLEQEYRIWDHKVSLEDHPKVKEDLRDKNSQIRKFLDQYDYRKYGFSEALKSKNEIMIGCDEYYLLDMVKFNELWPEVILLQKDIMKIILGEKVKGYKF